jgi:hypothetical protein
VSRWLGATLRFMANDKKIKSMTVRLPADQAEELEAVAEVDGVSVADAVRGAIDHHIAARRRDKEFKARLKQTIEEHQDILDRLSK